MENENNDNLNIDDQIKNENKTDSKKQAKKNSVGREAVEWILVVVIALLLSMLIKAFIFSTYKVNMVSMQNTLFEGQNLIVYKTGYLISQPKHNDIIVFTHEEGKFKGIFKYLPVRNPGEVDYIKRVIGTPGDVIDIREGYVYRKSPGESDFKKLDEPYTTSLTDTHGMQLPYTVEKEKLFVMGDNRSQSLDSRQIGPIDIDSVIGKATIRIWPFSKFGGVK